MNTNLALNTKSFSAEIYMNHEFDYGDFMRSTNAQLNHLRSELHLLGDLGIEDKLNDMQGYLQFTPNWDIDSTKARLCQDLIYIDQLLSGHAQDWES